MKLLIMCEGPNEKEIIDILLEHSKLIFTADDCWWRNSTCYLWHSEWCGKERIAGANDRL